jgi:predicted Zn-dependent protease
VAQRGFLLIAALLLGTATAWAQAPTGKSGAPLLAPQEVVLYVHSQLKSTDFIEPLICALSRVLVAPVRRVSIDLPITRDLMASPSQLDVQKVANRFNQATAAEGNSRTFKYLLLPYDLKVPELHYVFATSFGDQTTRNHLGIISTARLDTSDPRIPHHVGAATTALRTYKLVLKSVARVAGYTQPEGCILAFPRSLDDLDQKAAQFCPSDHAVLVAAGILKEKEGGECDALISQAPHAEVLASH